MSLLQDIKNGIGRSMDLIVDGFTQGLPKVIMVIILLLIFWMVGKFVKRMLIKSLNAIKLDAMMDRIELSPILGQIGIKSSTNFLAALTYWMIMLIGLLTITEIVNMGILTQGVAEILAYIPKLLVALVIFLIGMMLANTIKKVVYNATNSIGLSGSRVISNIVYYVLFIFIAITAINQTGVDTSIITSNVTLVFGAMLLAFAVSYGFAARDIMSNMLSTFYKKDRYQVGMRIKVQGEEGVIVGIDNLSVTLDTGEREVVLPTKLLIEEKVEIFK